MKNSLYLSGIVTLVIFSYNHKIYAMGPKSNNVHFSLVKIEKKNTKESLKNYFYLNLVIQNRDKSDLIVRTIKGKKFRAQQNITPYMTGLVCNAIYHSRKNLINFKLYRAAQLIGKIEIKKEKDNDNIQLTLSEFLPEGSSYKVTEEKAISYVNGDDTCCVCIDDTAKTGGFAK